MNTEIKFRVWDKQENKFFEPTYEAYKGNLSELLIGMSGQVLLRTLDGVSLVDDQNGRWIKSMYTGLKDRNGKEIFEGDILALDDVIGEVTFSDGSFQMILDSSAGRSPILQERTKQFTVIGNIYENSDLLSPPN